MIRQTSNSMRVEIGSQLEVFVFSKCSGSFMVITLPMRAGY